MKGRRARRTQEFVVLMCCLVGAFVLFVLIATGVIAW